MLTNEQRLDKILEEVREKVIEGWQIEAISVTRSKTEGDKKIIYVEVELLEQ